MIDCDTSSRTSHSRPAIGAIGRWIIAIALFATVAITGVFLAILVMHARRQARTNQCWGNLVAIVLGMHYHDDKYGHLPPAYVANPEGKRLHSWRILLVEHYGLPFPVQYDFNEAWDHGDNQRVADYRPVMYACTSDPVTQKNHRLTNYFVITGRNTPFPGSRTAPLPRSADGIGSSNTILIVESTNRVLSASVQNLALDLNGLFGIFPGGWVLARSGIRRAGMGRAGARTGRVSTRDGLGPAGFRLARDAATARISAA